MIDFNKRNLKPMLLKEVDKPFNSSDYIFEMKYDGIRALIYVNSKRIHIMSRNNIDLTHLYPELETLKKLVKKDVIFDGEIVLLDDFGNPTFSSLLERNRLKKPEKIKNLSRINPVIFIAFDIIYENKDLTNLTLMERKELLNKYQDTDEFVKAKYIDSQGIPLFKEIKKNNLEGIVAKNKNSTYHEGKRTSDFVKIKNIKRDEFVIGGYSVNDKNLSVYLGNYKNNQLLFVGKCSLSLNREEANLIMKHPKTKNPFADLNEDIIFIKPNLLCFIKYTELTKNGHLRHPVFKYLK